MGIYSNGSIWGIKIYNFTDDISNILYEEKYDSIMNHEQMRKTYLFYLTLNDKNLFFSVYTECSSTLNKNTDNYMTWYPLPLSTFLEVFNV